MNRETAVRKIQAAVRRPRFVNKFLENEYALTKPVVTSTIVSMAVPFVDISGAPLPAGVDELLGYTVTGKKPVIRKVRGRNAILGADKTETTDVKRWAFTVKFSNPKSKAYVSYMDKGRLQVNTTGPYERVIRFLNKTYLPGIFGLPVTIEKIDTKMNINRYLNLASIGKEIIEKLPKSKLRSWVYEPELMPGGYLKLASPRVTIIMYTGGTILTLGIKKFEDVGVTSKILEDLFEKYKFDRTKVFKYARQGDYMGIAKPPVAARKNLAAKRAKMTESRYMLAAAWNNTKAGHYVRPGPNGKPRFYPLVTNLRLVRPKVVRAYADAGVNIPSGVRNALGIEAGAEPAVKAEARRAPNWSSQKNGYYVKPGPGGQPYFYKVPKGKTEARKTVIAAYAKAGRNVPQGVRMLFGIEGSTPQAALKQTHYVNYNAGGQIRINGRQFNRFTRPELVQIARNLNIPEVSNTSSLKNIAGYITRAVAPVVNRPNAMLNGVPVFFMNNGRVKRGSRARQWATLPVAEQNALALAFLSNDEHAKFTGLAKKNRLPFILGHKQQHTEERINSAKAASVNQTTSSASSVTNAFAKNLEDEMRAYALLGNGASNKNVANFKAVIATLPVGARGKVLKPVMNKALRQFKEGNKSSEYMAAIKVPNWLPKNRAEAYKKALASIALQKTAKGKFPKKEAVQRGIRAWLESELPQRGRVSYTKENMFTGEMIKVPAWNPAVIKTPNVPNQPGRVPINAPHTGPVKKAKKDPRENKAYAIPKNYAAENMVNAIAGLGLPIVPSNSYSWTFLRIKGLNERFYTNWLNFAPGQVTLADGTADLDKIKTAKGRKEWLAVHKPSLNKTTYKALSNHVKVLEKRNQDRRAAAK